MLPEPPPGVKCACYATRSVSSSFRKYERYPSTLTVQVTGDGTTRFGTIYEVSQGGAFLEVSPLPSVGSTVTVLIPLGERRVSIRAEVRYYCSSMTGPRGLEGVGVAWVDPGEAERAFIAEWLENAKNGKRLRDYDGD